MTLGRCLRETAAGASFAGWLHSSGSSCSFAAEKKRSPRFRHYPLHQRTRIADDLRTAATATIIATAAAN